VKVLAAGVNPVDTYRRSGSYAALPALPWTPGSDGSGEVTELGEGVSRVKVGDRVWLSGSLTGTYSQYALVSETDAHPLPEKISFDQGAAVYIAYATAYHALHHIGRPHEQNAELTKNAEKINILVHGASGGVGIAAVQLCKCIPNAVIIGTAGTEEGIKAVLANGAHHALNHRQEGYLSTVSELTGGRGVDIVLEMLANINLTKDCQILAVGGRICVVGNRGSLDFNPRDLMQKRSEVRGVILPLATPTEKQEIISKINQGLQDGHLNPLVHLTFPLAEAPKAHVAVIDADKSSAGKIIIRTWE